MYRTDIKIQLFNEFISVFNTMSANSQLKGARSFLGFTRRSLLKDYKKAFRQIDKKIPVFVELPTYEKCGNGMTKQVFEDEEETPGQNDLIVVEDLSTTPASKE
ncbi:MAG: hypothetical protein IKI95_06995 [Clostridia bacterium]|nr:hypothetical protein [Clostridia bacterium]